MSELDYGDGLGGDHTPPADEFGELGDGDLSYEPALDPSEVDAIQREGFAQVEQAVGEFQAATGSWRPSKDEWDAAMAQLEQEPSWQEYRSETQMLNRAHAEIDAFLGQLPEGIRGRALELADQAAEKASAAYGPDPQLARASLEAGAQAAAQEAAGVQEFVAAAAQVAKRLGVENVDPGAAYLAAKRELPGLAEKHPGYDLAMLVALSIVGAVSAQHPAGPDRPLQVSDIHGTAGSIAADLRDRSLPKPATSTVDYQNNPTLRAADVASGRVRPQHRK